MYARKVTTTGKTLGARVHPADACGKVRVSVRGRRTVQFELAHCRRATIPIRYPKLDCCTCDRVPKANCPSVRRAAPHDVSLRINRRAIAGHYPRLGRKIVHLRLHHAVTVRYNCIRGKDHGRGLRKLQDIWSRCRVDFIPVRMWITVDSLIFRCRPIDIDPVRTRSRCTRCNIGS
jgi:hypothetical protein